MTQQILIYAGPTLHGTSIDTAADPAIQWAPPVKRDDIEDLLRTDRNPRTLAIVDGTFHDYPSVSHHEIRHALEAGWRIYGLSSMGAIRACEMAHLGMTPFGQVAQRYLQDPDFNDDEVTLVHGTEAPYHPLSEPLIHMREYLDKMLHAGHLTASQVQAVLAEMQPRWYGERTLRTLQVALTRATGQATLTAPLAEALRNFQPYRVKQRDLLAFLHAKSWLT